MNCSNINPDNLYNFRIKPLFKRCGFQYKRFKDGPTDLYFFDEMRSAWAALKTDGRLILTDKNSFKPKWKAGEIGFLRKVARCPNVKSIIIFEFKDRSFYCEEIKQFYTLKELLHFDLQNFIL